YINYLISNTNILKIKSIPTRRSSDQLVNVIQKTLGGILLAFGILGMIGAVIATFAISMETGPDIFNTDFVNLTGLGYSKWAITRSEEHTSELQSRENLVCCLLLEKKK